jgi:RimJ/RimL family protein N-acetyltransferase
MILETRRLNVRAATLADVDLYDSLWNNPRVMAYVGFPHGLGISQAEIQERLSRPEGDKFGRLLVVELKTTGQAIGECWMGRPDEQGIAEPDVKLLPEFWGVSLHAHRL